MYKLLIIFIAIQLLLVFYLIDKAHGMGDGIASRNKEEWGKIEDILLILYIVLLLEAYVVINLAQVVLFG